MKRVSSHKPPATTNYLDVRHLFRSGDLMVLKRPGLIQRHTHGEASHVGNLVWRHADQSSLCVAESRERVGSRVVSLSSQIRDNPGLISIYTPDETCPDELRERMATIAFNWAGHSYDYPGIARRMLVRLPLLYELAYHLGYRPDLSGTSPSPWAEPKVCSGLVLFAVRKAKLELAEERLGQGLPRICRSPFDRGWDPCPGKSDRFVTPSDLAGSPAYKLVAENLVIED